LELLPLSAEINRAFPLLLPVFGERSNAEEFAIGRTCKIPRSRPADHTTGDLPPSTLIAVPVM
jgi:hypothetical protein